MNLLYKSRLFIHNLFIGDAVYVVDFFQCGLGIPLPFPAFHHAGFYCDSLDDQLARLARYHRYGIDDRLKIGVDDRHVVRPGERKAEGRGDDGEDGKESGDLEVRVQSHFRVAFFDEAADEFRGRNSKERREGPEGRKKERRDDGEPNPAVLENSEGDSVNSGLRVGFERDEEPRHRFVFLVVPRRMDGEEEFYEIVRVGLLVEHGRKPLDEERAYQPHQERSVQKGRERFDVLQIGKILRGIGGSGRRSGTAFDLVEGFAAEERNTEKNVDQVDGIVVYDPLSQNVEEPLAVDGVLPHRGIDLGDVFEFGRNVRFRNLPRAVDELLVGVAAREGDVVLGGFEKLCPKVREAIQYLVVFDKVDEFVPHERRVDERFFPKLQILRSCRVIGISEAREEEIPCEYAPGSAGPFAVGRELRMRRERKVAKPVEKPLEHRHSGKVDRDGFVFGYAVEKGGLLFGRFEFRVLLSNVFVRRESLQAFELRVEQGVLVEHEEEEIRIAVVAFFEILVEIGFLFGEFFRVEVVGVRNAVKTGFAVTVGDFDELLRGVVVIARLDGIDERISEFENGFADFRDGKQNRKRVFRSRERFDLFEDFRCRYHVRAGFSFMVPLPFSARKKARIYRAFSGVVPERSSVAYPTILFRSFNGIAVPSMIPDMTGVWPTFQASYANATFLPSSARISIATESRSLRTSEPLPFSAMDDLNVSTCALGLCSWPILTGGRSRDRA